MTNVEISVTIMNGIGGTYPLRTPRAAIPNGTAKIQPLPTFSEVETKTPFSRSSGEYTPVNGEVASQAATKGNAVTSTAVGSSEPVSLCEDLPMAAKMMRLKVSITARSGRSNGVYVVWSPLNDEAFASSSLF